MEQRVIDKELINEAKGTFLYGSWERAYGLHNVSRASVIEDIANVNRCLGGGEHVTKGNIGKGVEHKAVHEIAWTLIYGIVEQYALDNGWDDLV